MTLNNGLLAAIDPSGIPEPATGPARWGAWVENACLAFAWNSRQRVRYWREEPYEVDAILDGSWGHWAIEVTTGVPSSRAVRGLAEFTRRYPKYSPLLLTEETRTEEARRTGFETMPWTRFLLDGLPRKGAES